MTTDNRIPLCADETIDMGSFTITGKNGNIYTFTGLSKDISKLPKVQAIGTGSLAICVDDGSSYMYEATTKTWYEQ